MTSLTDPSRPTASLDLHVEWPTHGRCLQLGEVTVSEGEAIDGVLQRVWHELLRIAADLGVSNPAQFRAIRLEWPARGGTAGRLAIHPNPLEGGESLRRELVSALGLELVQFGFDWGAVRTSAERV